MPGQLLIQEAKQGSLDICSHQVMWYLHRRPTKLTTMLCRQYNLSTKVWRVLQRIIKKKTLSRKKSTTWIFMWKLIKDEYLRSSLIWQGKIIKLQLLNINMRNATVLTYVTPYHWLNGMLDAVVNPNYIRHNLINNWLGTSHLKWLKLNRTGQRWWYLRTY